MKLFVIGHSGAGKSTLARFLGVPVVSGGQWVRQRTGIHGHSESDVAALNKASREALSIYPSVARDSISESARLAGEPCVIEGIRNPVDFAHLFDPRTDAVVFLLYPGQFNAFEGIGVIRAMVNWHIDNGLFDASRFGVFEAPHQRDAAFAFAMSALSTTESIDQSNAIVHASISYSGIRYQSSPDQPLSYTPYPQKSVASSNPINAEVRASLLFRDEARTDYLPCSIIGVSSYAGHQPTLRALLDDGRTLFDYLPIHAFRWKDIVNALPDDSLVYRNCPSHVFCTMTPPKLVASVYFKAQSRWISAMAIVSIDWYTSNDSGHLLALETGQFAVMPNHKIQWGHMKSPELKPYRAIKQEWVCG